jgi:hypothetical protein
VKLCAKKESWSKKNREDLKRGKALCFNNSKLSEKKKIESMNLSMFNRLYPSLKARA